MTNGDVMHPPDRLFPPSCLNEMHLPFWPGVWIFCYVCTEYASAGVGGCVVKGCGYPCQAVRTYGVQGMFWQGSLDYVHCQSTWFILDSILSYWG